ncbi:MAG: MFS transporter, partial [Brooklawnia sp.]|nr:MFS transporter [Brooklawnia sp.]
MTQRLFTPTFIGLAVANFCNAMIFFLLVPTMAGYAADEFGASA